MILRLRSALMNQMNPMNHVRRVRCIEKYFSFPCLNLGKINVFGRGVVWFLGSSRFIWGVFIYSSLITINKLLVISSLDVSNVRG